MSLQFRAQPLRQPQVILLEDDGAVRRSLQLLLQGQGYDVRAFASSAQMLADALTDEAACLVADYHLDGISGIDVLAILRARGWPGPAILVTGAVSADLTRKAQQTGFAAVLQKPLEPRALKSLMAKLLSTH